MVKAVKIRPFVPSGSDYLRAVSFFSDLGFQKIFSSEDLTLFTVDGTEFFLQRYENEALQSNYMLELCVEGLDSWWRRIEEVVVEKYGLKVNPPHALANVPGKRVIELIDLAGVLWHITE